MVFWRKKYRVSEETKVLQERYLELSEELVDYRDEYMLIQTVYPPESDYLSKQLKLISDKLYSIRYELSAIGDKINNEKGGA